MSSLILRDVMLCVHWDCWFSYTAIDVCHSQVQRELSKVKEDLMRQLTDRRDSAHAVRGPKKPVGGELKIPATLAASDIKGQVVDLGTSPPPLDGGACSAVSCCAVSPYLLCRQVK